MDGESRFTRLLSAYSATSQVAYKRRADDFKEFCAQNSKDSSKKESLLDYLHHLRDDEEFDYHGSTLWTISSMLNTWYEAVQAVRRGSTAEESPEGVEEAG